MQSSTILTKLIFIGLYILLSSNSITVKGQNGHKLNTYPGIDSLFLHLNDGIYSLKKNTYYTKRKSSLVFHHTQNDPMVMGELYINKSLKGILHLLASEDYMIIDSLAYVNQHYQFKIRFNNIANSDFLSLRFAIDSSITEIPLLPITKTSVDFRPPSEDLVDYKLQKINDKGYISIEPKKSGEHLFSFKIETKKPFIDSLGNLSTLLALVQKRFIIKPTRISILRFDNRQIIRDPNIINTTEVQVENHRYLQIGQRYRIEASEEPGSPLIAELIPIKRFSNDKMVCNFRAYNNHLSSQGNLFVKDDTRLLFLTNIDIIPTPSVEKISILRQGGEWTTNLSVKPGEQFMLRIEGQFLQNAKFNFDELINISSDTLQNSTIVRNYYLKTPIGISKKKLNIHLNNKPTNIEIAILEHQHPRPIDFLSIDYGNGNISTEDINQPILHPKTIKDIIIRFDRKKIDGGELLYGRQHIRIRIRLEDKLGILMESAILGTFFICPDENSPRFSFYPKNECRLDEIKVNDFIGKKTYTMEEWGKIEITFEHVNTSYTTEGYSKRIVIYNQKITSFDVDVSVPAGLFIQKLGKNEPLASLSGISFAMIAQFSFYKKDEIKKLLPIKAGIGFLAQNAFNFNPSAERDLGIIALVSVYPIRSNSKVSFPLYGGGGYFLQGKKFFVLIGPGIRVSF
jgi:hypothetical protein